jgi:hypothetical protein
MIMWKGYGRKQLWPNGVLLFWHLTGGTEEIHEEHQSGWVMSQAPSEYKSRALSLCQAVQSFRINREIGKIVIFAYQ